MKQITTLSLIATLSFANVQGQGIKFEEGLNWQQIQAKAKQEHKDIFVDCYASWCGPCKAMDKNVYVQKEVGDAVNSRFISVKLQMDRTSNDDKQIQEWYGVAESFEKFYKVSIYPTFLFLDAEGKPLHKMVGYKQATDFIKLASDAENPEKQYYSLLQNFKPRTMDTAELKGLARSFHYLDKDLAGKLASDYLVRISAKELSLSDNRQLIIEFKDDRSVLAVALGYLRSLTKSEFSAPTNLQFVVQLGENMEVRALARIYINHLTKKALGENKNLQFMSGFRTDSVIRQVAVNYINRLSVKEILTKEKIKFLTSFTNTLTDRGFAVFYNYQDKVNVAVGNLSYAQDMVHYVVKESEVDPLIKSAKESGIRPDFDSMAQSIAQKYGQYYADRIIAEAKLNWYGYLVKITKTHWQQYLPEFIKSRMEQILTQRLDTVKSKSTFVNNVCWLEIYLSSNESRQIDIAINWMSKIVDRSPNDPDYLDTYACLLYKAGRVSEALAAEGKSQEISPQNNEIKDRLEGMKKGEKVWLSAVSQLERDKHFGH